MNIAAERPNIVLIIMDCARADHMSCYGYRRPTTPNLDRIAAQGTVYEVAISPAVWTLPSMASLFTGLYPSQHGTGRSHQWLDDRFTTLAEMLGRQGYETAAFSANPWVSQETNLARGFDHFQPVWGVIDSQGGRLAAVANRAYQLVRKRFYHTLKRINPLRKAFAMMLEKRKDKGGAQINHAVEHWLSNRGSTHPFFLFLHYMDAHEPFFAPEPYGSMFLDGLNSDRVRSINQDGTRYLARQVEMTSHDFEILKALYDGQMAYQDAKIGELWDCIQQAGSAHDTLGLITSDHGQVLGEDPGIMGHGYSMHDSLIRVPLITSQPLPGERERRVTKLVQTVDIFPTLSRLCGAPSDQADLALDIAADEERAFTVSEFLDPDIERFRIRFPEFDPTPYDRILRAVRTRSAKYVWASAGTAHFYDLEQDAGEQQDLVASRGQDVAHLQAQLDSWLEQVREPELDSHTADMDPETVERLKGLGYLG